MEPFGEDWLRSARSTMYLIAALGTNPDPRFVEMFLPSYDPDREMTEDEITAELTKYAGNRNNGRDR